MGYPTSANAAKPNWVRSCDWSSARYEVMAIGSDVSAGRLLQYDDGKIFRSAEGSPVLSLQLLTQHLQLPILFVVKHRGVGRKRKCWGKRTGAARNRSLATVMPG